MAFSSIIFILYFLPVLGAYPVADLPKGVYELTLYRRTPLGWASCRAADTAQSR